MRRYLSLALVLLLTTFLLADKEFDASLSVSTHHPVVWQPVILKLLIRHSPSDKVLQFDFHPHSTAQYKVKFLESSEKKNVSGYDQTIFTYALFPLKKGKLTLQFHFITKEATQDEIKKFVTGSADELTYLQTTNKVIKLKPLTLDVAPLDKGTKLVGDFTLRHAIDKHVIQPDEQVNITYTVQGRGYKPQIKELLKITNVSSFLSYEHFEDKLFYKEIYRYALLSDHNFTISALTIKAYNPDKKNYYTLKTDPLNITVTKPHKSNRSTFDAKYVITFFKNIISYILFFIAGLLAALLLHLNQHKPETTLEDQISSANNTRDLLRILLAHKDRSTSGFITQLEEAIYNKKEISLRKMKRDILRKVESKCLISS